MTMLNLSTCFIVFYSVNIFYSINDDGSYDWLIMPFDDDGGSWLLLFRDTCEFILCFTNSIKIYTNLLVIVCGKLESSRYNNRGCTKYHNAVRSTIRFNSQSVYLRNIWTNRQNILSARYATCKTQACKYWTGAHFKTSSRWTSLLIVVTQSGIVTIRSLHS